MQQVEEVGHLPFIHFPAEAFEIGLDVCDGHVFSRKAKVFRPQSNFDEDASICAH